MTKKEFLDGLRISLSGNVPNSEIENKIQYYKDYFSIEEKNGRSEEDICAELGDPKLIAKTIADTNTIQEESSDNSYTNVYNGDSNRYESNDSSFSGGNTSRDGFFYMNPGCGGVSGCLVAVLFIYVVAWIFGILLQGAFELSLLLFSSPLAIIILIILLFHIFSRRGY